MRKEVAGDAAGAAATIESRYVVGADGSRSAVREAAGLAFTGGTFPQDFLLVDCRVDRPLDHRRFRVFVDGPMIGLFLPLVTRYRAHHRSVDAYRRVRLFVAGDAAHIHSPAGGQGMNTGLQDVANLVWKLALRPRGVADDALLDDYDEERRPVGELVVRSTGKLFDAAVGHAGRRSRLRDRLAMTLLPIVSWLPPFHTKASFNSSQRAIGYSTSRFVADGPAWPKRGPKAGERAPGARINESLSMFDLLRGYRFTLVALSRAALGEDEIRAVRASLERLAARPPDCRTELVARVPRGRDAGARFVSAAGALAAYGLRDRRGDRQPRRRGARGRLRPALGVPRRQRRAGAAGHRRPARRRR